MERPAMAAVCLALFAFVSASGNEESGRIPQGEPVGPLISRDFFVLLRLFADKMLRYCVSKADMKIAW